VLADGGQLATTDVDFIGSRTGLLASLCELAGAESEISAGTRVAAASDKSAHIPGTKRIKLEVLELHDLILSKLRK